MTPGAINNKRVRLEVTPLGDPLGFQDAYALLADQPEQPSLGAFLARHPALALQPVAAETMALPLNRVILACKAVGPEAPLYRPPGLTVTPTDGKPTDGKPTDDTTNERPPPQASPTEKSPEPPPSKHPETLSDADAARIAHRVEIDKIASFLRAGLSVLVFCDKPIVQHLWLPITRAAALEGRPLEAEDDEEGPSLLGPANPRQRRIAALKKLLRDFKTGTAAVIPHLDLLAGGDGTLSPEARDLTELLSGIGDRLVLGFSDRSLTLPEVLCGCFDVRVTISGAPRSVTAADGREILLGEALVTRAEAERFQGFDAGALYKNVAGMNPVRLRHALAYAVREAGAAESVGVDRLIKAIREFKVQTSANFEVPDVRWADIGGYRDVKAELERAVGLLTGGFDLGDERLARELIPRGFIFWGPPGTGKTLFAKAVANRMNATVQVVSGPEITDKYVGESERKLRELFAEARRNAPSVLVFDEFDSIAGKRTGRDDGGSRAGNSVVAQILTEMDGFRPDVPMLVIGTTNRLDIIDDALLRPSRFQAINIGLPDREARFAIAKVHAKHFGVVVSDALLVAVAAATDGMNGDQIRSLFRDARVGLLTQNIAITPHRLGELIGRIHHGRNKQTVITPPERPTDGTRPEPSPSTVPLTPPLNSPRHGAAS